MTSTSPDAPAPAVSANHTTSRGLSPRDLINVGVFAALYFVVTFVLNMVGFAGPAFMFLGFLLGNLAGGTILALYVARVPKLGALTLLGLILGVAFTLTGHSAYMIIVSALLGLLADAILIGFGALSREHGLTQAKGKRVSTAFPLAYAVFSVSFVGAFIPLILNTKAYYQTISAQMGSEYAEAMAAIFQPWTVGVLAIGMFVLGLISGAIGVRVARKHFESAGLL